MKTAVLLLTLLLSANCHAFVMDFNISACEEDTPDGSLGCALYTTTSFPTMIVDDASDEIVWDIKNEHLIAQYKAELDGSSPIYLIKRYADVKTNGDVDAAKAELKKYIQNLESVQNQ